MMSPSNKEEAAEFRRVKLDAFGYMVSIISVSLDRYGDPVVKDRTFRQNTISYPDLTSEVAERMIISMGGRVIKWRYSDRTIYLPECTIEIENDGTILVGYDRRRVRPSLHQNYWELKTWA